MELLIENLTKDGLRRIIKTLEPQVALISVTEDCKRFNVLLQDENEWTIVTFKTAVKLYKNELVLGERSKQVTLETTEFGSITIH